MTERRVMAKPIDTYSRPSRAGLSVAREANREMARSWHEVMTGVGALIEDRRARALKEQTEDVNADANLKARALAAEYMPGIVEQMERPETYDMGVDEFLASPLYQEGAVMIQEGIPYPEHRKQFLANYQQMMLKKFTQGKQAQEQREREHTAALAQKGSAQIGGIEGQMQAYSESLQAGIDPDDVFDSGLATALLHGPEYLKQFAKARDWTPEQQLKIKAHIESATSQFNMEAEVAYKSALAQKDPQRQSEQLASVLESYGPALSNGKKATALSHLQVNAQKLQARQRVVSLLGRVSTKDIAEGVGMDGYWRVPAKEITELQNDAVRSALASGDVDTLIQLTAIPSDTPSALAEAMNDVIYSIGNADPEEPEAIEKTLTVANLISDTLGPSRLKQVMGADAYTKYTDFAETAKRLGTSQAIEQYKQVEQLTASGNIPSPEKWASTKSGIIDDVVKKLHGGWMGVGAKDAVNIATLKSTLRPYFKQARARGVTPEAMKKEALRLVQETSWNGLINGGVLGAHLTALTQGNDGNPYGSRSPADLLDEYKKLKAKELRDEGIEVESLHIAIGTNPNIVILQDTSGYPIPSALVNVEQIADYIRENVKTTKQQVKDARTPPAPASNEEIEAQASFMEGTGNASLAHALRRKNQ